MKLKTTKEETPSFMKRKSETKSKSNPKPASKNLHSGHRERLKSQYIQNGIHSMTDIQQLELLLFYAIPQKDTNPIAHALLNRFGTIKNVLNASVRDLCTVEGIKENSAIFLKIVSNMATVYSLPKPGETVGTTAFAKEYCSKFYVGVNLEQFHVTCLTKDNKVLGSKMIKSGTTDEVRVEIRDITEFAMSLNSNRIIVSHNHPQGSGTMSDEDCRFTYSLMCSCLLNEIDVLDHIIVGTDRAFAMSEHKIIQKLRKRAHDHVLISKDTQVFLSSLSENYIISETFDDLNINIDF